MVLIGMDVCSTLCHYDTWVHGKIVLRHTPKFVVMVTIRCLLGEDRFVVQLTQSLLGSYVVRSVKPTSTSILAEEG